MNDMSPSEWMQRELVSYEGTTVEEHDIHHAYSRLGSIFSRNPETIRSYEKFGVDLDATHDSGLFRDNELDQANSDAEEFYIILDKEKHQARIETVRDYVVLLAECRARDHNEYEETLRRWQVERSASGWGKWLIRLLGVYPHLNPKRERVSDFGRVGNGKRTNQ